MICRVGLDRGPHQIDPGGPEPTSAVKQRVKVVASTLQTRNPFRGRGLIGTRGPEGKIQPDQRGFGAHFDEVVEFLRMQQSNALAEAHGLPEMTRPVGRISDLFINESAGNIGNQRNLRTVQGECARDRFQFSQHRIGQGRMKRMGNPHHDHAQLRLLAECLYLRDRIRSPGHEDNFRTVHRGDRHRLREGRDQFRHHRFVSKNREHRPRGRPSLHEAPARRDQLQRVLHTENPGDARGRVFTYTVPQNDLRPHAHRLPDTGQRILDHEKTRLRKGRLVELTQRCHIPRPVEDRRL